MVVCMIFCPIRKLYKNSGVKSLRCFLTSFRHTMYRPTKLVERCQCCMRRVPLADAHRSMNFLENKDSSDVVYYSLNSYYILLLCVIMGRQFAARWRLIPPLHYFSNCVDIICICGRNIPQDLLLE